VSEFSGPLVGRGFGFAAVATPSQPRKHWMCESKPVCVTGAFGFRYPVSAIAKSDSPSFTHVFSPGLS
jgi:hypothetical protein